MKRLVRGQSTISFSALRSEANRLEEDGMGSSYENACVRRIQEPHHTPGEPSPLDRIAAQLELLATTQSEIVSLLRLQQQAPVGVVNPDKPEPRRAGAVCCEYCSRRGHTFARCWKRSSDRWHNGERSTNREYRGHSKGSTATNAMQCSQVGHPRYRPGRLNASGDGLSGKSQPTATTEVTVIGEEEIADIQQVTVLPCDLRQKLLKGTVRATTAQRRDILENVESPVLPSFRTDEIQEAQWTDPVLGRIWHYIDRGRNATRRENGKNSQQ